MAHRSTEAAVEPLTFISLDLGRRIDPSSSKPYGHSMLTRKSSVQVQPIQQKPLVLRSFSGPHQEPTVPGLVEDEVLSPLYEELP